MIFFVESKGIPSCVLKGWVPLREGVACVPSVASPDWRPPPQTCVRPDSCFYIAWIFLTVAFVSYEFINIP